MSRDDANSLLLQWLEWWKESPDTPPKMPNALHVRTAVYLCDNAGKQGEEALIELAARLIAERSGKGALD